MMVGNRSRVSRLVPIRTGASVNRMRAAVVSDPRWERMGVDMVIGIAEITDWDGKNRVDYDKHRRIWATGKVPGIQLVRKNVVPMATEKGHPARDGKSGGQRDPLDLPPSASPMVVNLILPPPQGEGPPQPVPETPPGPQMSTPIGTPPSILHINLGGASLVVPPRSEECFIAGMSGEPGVETRYKLTKIKDFLDEGGLAVCVAEAGVTGDTVSEGLRAALEPHRVFQHGAKSGILNHSVMMVINMGQKVGRVIRDPQRSGRAMAVDLIGPGGRASRGKQKIFRIAELYLPSGLDGTVGIIPANTVWTSKGALRRIEADRLARLTNEWSQGLEMMVVMGDLNETYRKQDRLSAVGSLKGAPKGAPTLSRMLNHGFVDLFPLARKEEKGWTSFRADGAKSRIDYGLASPALAGWLLNHPDSWDCFTRPCWDHRWRDRVETGMTGHYHAALQVDLPREVWGLAMPLQRKFKRN